MARSLLLHWVILQLQLYIACGMYHRVVKATVGQSVKLPCTYRVTHMSEISVMCWGRGLCPLSKCRNEIVRTDGQKVISSQSDRYRLKGSIARGDVSLTIDNVNHQDRGAYCCRVEIPGPFNDIKENLNLLVNRARLPPARTTTTAPPLTTTAPPLTTTTALPTHSVPTLTTTSNPPTTVPSTATIFQMITPCTEEAEILFYFVSMTTGSPMTILISERTEKVDTGFITEGDLSAGICDNNKRAKDI
ncbi:T-cell immunoglobulin and mucin domain-containing protein 4-like [Carettochelys insculpta]|uniref:T-cell immunoglobulin and mucin domain-containing protein 4-like n=1 Tax=Carettochelys insculpta TaxID=44489 RepID=UPI003EBFB958